MAESSLSVWGPEVCGQGVGGPVRRPEGDAMPGLLQLWGRRRPGRSRARGCVPPASASVFPGLPPSACVCVLRPGMGQDPPDPQPISAELLTPATTYS